MAPESEYVTGRWVTYTTGDWTAGARPNRRTRPGFFPSPRAVFVSFASGYTHLANIEYVELEG